jgi:hypothetical protein
VLVSRGGLKRRDALADLGELAAELLQFPLLLLRVAGQQMILLWLWLLLLPVVGVAGHGCSLRRQGPVVQPGQVRSPSSGAGDGRGPGERAEVGAGLLGEPVAGLEVEAAVLAEPAGCRAACKISH